MFLFYVGKILNYGMKEIIVLVISLKNTLKVYPFQSFNLSQIIGFYNWLLKEGKIVL